MADPTFVGASAYAAADFSSDYAVSAMPAGIALNDVLWAISPGTGGTGSHGNNTQGGAESDQWMNAPGFTNGYVGNVFNIHSGLWTRWTSGVTYNVGHRNFTGSGFMLAFRNVNHFSLTNGNSTTADAVATGTLSIAGETNIVEEGPSMEIVIVSQKWSVGTAPFVHCTFDLSSIGTLTNIATWAKTNLDYAEFLWAVRQPGEDFPALSVPFSNAQAVAFNNVAMVRLKSLHATDEVLPYGL